MQLTAMRDYTRKRGWEIAVEVKDLSDQERRSGQKREELGQSREGGASTSLSSGGLIVGDDPWLIL